MVLDRTQCLIHLDGEDWLFFLFLGGISASPRCRNLSVESEVAIIYKKNEDKSDIMMCVYSYDVQPCDRHVPPLVLVGDIERSHDPLGLTILKSKIGSGNYILLYFLIGFRKATACSRRGLIM